MRIAIGNDHGGYALKQSLLEFLRQERPDIEIEDIGCHSEDIVRYPYYAERVARAVQEEKADRGILICSTGIGMSMVANRFRHIRATLCTSTYMGKMSRAHNDSNILCLGGKITGVFEALDIVEAWLTVPFSGDRHNISLGLLAEIDEGKAIASNEDQREGGAAK